MGLDPKKVRAVQLNLEGLLRLLGGTEADREKFWEIQKGVTTRLEAKIINSQLDAMAAQAKVLQTSTKELKDTAQEVARRG
jgi:hypothetical protein